MVLYATYSPERGTYLINISEQIINLLLARAGEVAMTGPYGIIIPV